MNVSVPDGQDPRLLPSCGSALLRVVLSFQRALGEQEIEIRLLLNSLSSEVIPISSFHIPLAKTRHMSPLRCGGPGRCSPWLCICSPVRVLLWGGGLGGNPWRNPSRVCHHSHWMSPKSSSSWTYFLVAWYSLRNVSKGDLFLFGLLGR